MGYVEAKVPSEGRLLGSIAAVLIENSLMKRFCFSETEGLYHKIFFFEEISSPSSVQVSFFFKSSHLLL